MYRIYIDSYFKAAHIVKDRKDAEMFLPKTRGCIVKDFCGKRLMETYLVSWMGDHFNGTPASANLTVEENPGHVVTFKIEER